MRRPIAETRIRVKKGLKRKNRELSWRKRVCLAYLDWGVTKSKKDLRKFVETTVEWRKVEGKVGRNRTKLEKMARKLFAEVKRQKRSERFTENSTEIGKRNVEQKRGFLSDEMQKNAKEKMLRARQIGDLNGTRMLGIWWIIYPPDGEPYKIRNLAKFCRETGLSPHCMKNTALNPAKGRTHKGWRCEHWDEDWDRLHEDG